MLGKNMEGESMHIGRDRWLGTVFKWLDRAVRGGSIIVGGFRTAKPEKFPELMAPFIDYIQEGWVIPTFLIGGPAVIYFRHKTDKSKLEAVHSLLDQICEDAFKNQSFELDQHRRVTLFQHRRFCWRRWPFFGGWLIPIERSGNHTRKTNAIFYAPDDGESSEGVAGRAWSRRKNVLVEALPDLRSKKVTDEDFLKYAEKSFCKANKLRRKPPQARSLLGIPIDVGNKMWGVIVFDSVNEGIPKRAAEGVFNKLAPTMTSYLKGL